MHKSSLRKVGGSVMLVLPPAVLNELDLHVGSTVGIDVEENRLIVQPQRPQYSLEQLLSEWKSVRALSDEGCEWIDLEPVGKEL